MITPQTVRAYEIHEALQTWITQNYGNDDPVVILAALSFEVGRVIGVGAADEPAERLNEMVRNVTAIMRSQIAMYRRGMFGPLQ
jgi:hypothetical protein